MTTRLPTWDPNLPASTVICVGAPGEKTLAELAGDVAAVAARIGPLESGRRTLVVCKDRYLLTVGTLAVWQAGGQVALPPNTRPETLRELLAPLQEQEQTENGGHHFLHDGAPSGLENLGGTNFRTWLEGAEPSADPTPPLFAESRILAVLHTSGSRDRARAFSKTAGQLLGEARMLTSALLLPRGRDVRGHQPPPLVSTVPAHHIYGLLFSVLAPLAGGIPFVRETPFFPESVATAVATHGAGTLVSVPAHLRSLEALDDDALPDRLQPFSSGAPLPEETAEMLHRKFGLCVREVFGSTETGGIAHRLSPPGGSWTPLPGVDVSTDTHDTLHVDSPFIAPDAARPHPCADRAVLLEDGSFRHLGRADDVVKVAGKRVDTANVEQRLLAMAGVLDAAVAAYDSSAGRQKELRAAVATEAASALTPAVLRERLRQFLDPVVVPRIIRVVEALPRTSTGKLRKADLDALLCGPPRVSEHSGFSANVRSTQPEHAEVELLAVRDWGVFAGHFPEHPIVPGAAQLSKLVEQCADIWPDLGPLTQVSRLKFIAPLGPDVKVLARLQRKNAQTRVRFEIVAGKDTLTRGILTFQSSS